MALQSQEVLGVSGKVIEAFHMMWDSFPHTVLLLKKSREIVAVNKAGEEKGISPCAKCFQLGGKTDIHAGCKANVALAENTPQRSVSFNQNTNRVMDAYWLPVSVEDELYLHFAVYVDLSAEKRAV